MNTIYPVTPANTEIEYSIDEQGNRCELVIPELILDDQMYKKVISLSGSVTSNTTPRLSSSETPNFSDKEIDYESELQKYYQEVRNLKYKIINLDMEKRRIEEECLYLLDDISSKNEKIVNLEFENKKLNKDIVGEKESHYKTKIIAAITIFFSGILFTSR